MRYSCLVLGAMLCCSGAAFAASTEEVRLAALAGDATLSKAQTGALDYCSALARGAFSRAVARPQFKTSASAHALVEKEKPGEETAQEIHKLIELVYMHPEKAPNELAGIAFARCMTSFEDDLEGRR